MCAHTLFSFPSLSPLKLLVSISHLFWGSPCAQLCMPSCAGRERDECTDKLFMHRCRWSHMHLVHAHVKRVLASACFMLMFTYPNVNLCAHTPTSACQMFKQFQPSLVRRKRGGGNVLTVIYNCLLQTDELAQEFLVLHNSHKESFAWPVQRKV